LESDQQWVGGYDDAASMRFDGLFSVESTVKPKAGN